MFGRFRFVSWYRERLAGSVWWVYRHRDGFTIEVENPRVVPDGIGGIVSEWESVRKAGGGMLSAYEQEIYLPDLRETLAGEDWEE